jgi:predicted metal-dependent HD superfamily phosphohydrolase
VSNADPPMLHHDLTAPWHRTWFDLGARLLVDMDLAIQGAPPQRFADYEAQVQREYAWAPK